MACMEQNLCFSGIESITTLHINDNLLLLCSIIVFSLLLLFCSIIIFNLSLLL